MKRFLSICLLAIGTALCAVAQTPDWNAIAQRDRDMAVAKAEKAGLWREYLSRDTRPMDNYDVNSYTLHIQVFTDDHTISGDNTIGVTTVQDGVTTVTFDFLDNMQIDSVTLNDNIATFNHSDDQVTVDLPWGAPANTPLTIVIAYHGAPQSSDFIGGGMFFTSHAGVPLVYTCVEPFAARSWMPCKDVPNDKAEHVDQFITCDSDYKVACNGLLQSEVDNGDGTKTFHWYESHPISTYLISLALSNYAVFQQTYTAGNGIEMPLWHYVLPEDYDNSVALLSQTTDFIELLVGWFGEYPFLDEKYGHATAPGLGGAMENQTCTTIGSGLMQDGYQDIVVHELSHQWCGDMITCGDWANIWLNEGTAEYTGAIYYGDVYGDWGYHAFMDAIDGGNQIDDKLQRDPDASGDEVLDWVVYAKGAWVWHMLRGVMGDERFHQLLLNYFADPDLRFGNAVTQDLCDHAEAVMGEDMNWFFDEWFTQVGRPQYDYVVYTANGHNDFRVGILSEGSAGVAFSMPVTCRVDNIDQSVFVPGGVSHTTLTGEPETLTWDPDDWVLDYGYTLVTPVLQAPTRTRDGIVNLILPDWFDTGFAGFNVSRASVGSNDWIVISTAPVTGASYLDTTADPGESYQYRVQAIYIDNSVAFHSEPSNAVTLEGADFTLDQGILLVDAAYDYPGDTMPSDAQVDAFYSYLLDLYHVTTWSVADQGIPSLSVLAQYSTVVWVADDITSTPLSAGRYSLESYMAAGGHLVISAWRYLTSLPQSETSAFFGYDFTNVCSTPQFAGAHSADSYPYLPVDAAKVTLDQWNGRLAYTNIFQGVEGAEVIYRFDAFDDNPDWENLPSALHIPNKLYIFGFPLYYIQNAPAREMITQVMAEFNEPADSSDQVAQYPEYRLVNMPNPFNPVTDIAFSLPSADRVRIDIFNARGERVRTLADERMNPGEHRLQWNGASDDGSYLASGIYLARLQAGNRVSLHKMLLMK
jgi:hypothetical protein